MYPLFLSLNLSFDASQEGKLGGLFSERVEVCTFVILWSDIQTGAGFHSLSLARVITISFLRSGGQVAISKYEIKTDY